MTTEKPSLYDPTLGVAVVELWNGVHYHPDGIWSELIIYALTFQLMFYITIISVKCARDRIREHQMDLRNPLIDLLPEEDWHLGEQYEEFIEKQGNEAFRLQQEKITDNKKAEKKKKKNEKKKKDEEASKGSRKPNESDPNEVTAKE